MLYKSKSVVGNRRHPAASFCLLEMNLWLLLVFAALAECGPCPLLCSCSFPPSGAEVSCSHGSMSQFPSDGLPPNTTRLSVQSTGLSRVTAGHLLPLPRLKTLQLYRNNLTGLESDLLSGVAHLDTLDLTGSGLVGLPARIFDRASLRSLVLKDNLLERAEAEWFPLNSSVTWLDLSGNRLSSVPDEMFQRLPRLENLDLSHNDLQELRPHALEPLHRLETLNLAGNKLVSLKPESFSHNLKLSQLFLQENRLQELPAALFHGLTHLELLLLNQNQLRSLPAGLLDGRRAPFHTILTGNPWRCDGNVQYLWKWLRENPQSVFFLHEVTCDGPETLKLEQVFSLTEQQLGLIKIS